YEPLDEFKARMDQLIDQLHGCPRAPGVDRIYVAGEIEHGLETKRRQEGVPIEESVMAELERVQGELGVGRSPERSRGSTMPVPTATTSPSSAPIPTGRRRGGRA